MAPVLSLYASGRTTGLVVDSGHGLTEICGVEEGGYPLPHEGLSLNVNGADISNLLRELLVAKGYDSIKQSDVIRMKEKLARVPLNYGEIEEKVRLNKIYQTRVLDINNAHSSPENLLHSLPQELVEHLVKFSIADTKPTFCSLPDGTKIEVGAEALECGNVLFEPTRRYESLSAGLADMIVSATNKVKSDTRSALLQNVILAGGTTLMPGFQERLAADLNAQSPYKQCEVIAPNNQITSAWTGGSILVSLSTFEPMWVTSQHYVEEGPETIHRQCF